MVKFMKIFAVLAAVAASTVAMSAQTVIVRTEHTVSTDRGRYESRRDFKKRSFRGFWKKERLSVRGGMAVPSYTMASFAEGQDYLRSWPMETGTPISEIYADYNGPTYSTGAFCLGAEYMVARWFAVSADLSVTPVWHDLYSSITEQKTGTRSGVAFCLVPQAKFVFLNRPWVRLYGKFGIGVVKYFGFDMRNKKSFNFDVVYSDNSFNAGFQWVPLGIEVGRKFFGYAEAGVGTLYRGISAGVGYKF